MKSLSKYISLAITATFLLASCESDSPEPDIASGSEMEFGVDGVSADTRAFKEIYTTPVTTNANITERKFGVWGDMKLLNGTVQHDFSPVLQNAQLYYSSGKWLSNKTANWYPNHEHSFVAYMPYNGTGITGSKTKYTGNTLSFEYTIQEGLRNAFDFLTATHRRRYGEEVTNPEQVKFQFHHILSLLNMYVTFDEELLNKTDDARMTNITFYGISKTGTYSITPAPLPDDSTSTDDYINESWTLNDPKPYVLTFTYPITNSNKPIGIFPSNIRPMYMIPQKREDVYITLTYEISVNCDCNTETAQNNCPHTLGPLKVTSNTFNVDWEMGKEYTYNMMVYSDRIQITGLTVTDWKEVMEDEEKIEDTQRNESSATAGVGSGTWTDKDLGNQEI